MQNQLPSSSVVSGACCLIVKIRRSLQLPETVMPSNELNDVVPDQASLTNDRMSTHRFNHCDSKQRHPSKINEEKQQYYKFGLITEVHVQAAEYKF